MRTTAVKPAILLGIVITLGIPGISPAQTSDFEPVAPRTGSARLAGFGGAYTALEAGLIPCQPIRPLLPTFQKPGP